MLPNICNIYNMGHPTFHPPLGKHDFCGTDNRPPVNQSSEYQQIRNVHTSGTIFILLWF